MKKGYKSPLQGKYLIRNKLLYWSLRCIDFYCYILTILSKKNFSIKQPNAILLSNLAQLGDVVLMTSLFPIIKKAFPSTKIGVIIGSWALDLIQDSPYIDNIYLLDHWKTSRKKSSIYKKLFYYYTQKKKIFEKIKKERYDLAVELSYNFPNSICLFKKLKIPVTIGYSSGGFGSLLTHSVDWKYEKKSVVLYFSNLLQKFLDVSVFYSFLKPNIQKKDASFLSNFKLAPKNFLVLHIGSGSSAKEWSLKQWKSLVNKLNEHILCFTGKGEKENKEITEVIGDNKNCINLCNKLSINCYIEVIRNAKLLIGVDSSAGHIAAATNTPSILLYSGIHPVEQWAPFNSSCKVLINKTSCYPCFNRKGCSDRECIQKIDAEYVFSEVQKKLQSYRSNVISKNQISPFKK